MNEIAPPTGQIKIVTICSFSHFYPYCWTSNYNQPSIAIYYGGCAGGGFGSGGGSGGDGCGGGVGGRVMVVA